METAAIPEAHPETGKPPRLAFSILKGQFVVALKITIDEATELPPDFTVFWTEPSKETGVIEKHVLSPATQNRQDFFNGEDPLEIKFSLPDISTSRVFLHFRKKNPNLQMAAGRFRNSKDLVEIVAFGLSVQTKKPAAENEKELESFNGKQNYLNIGWYIKEVKEPEFHPLFLKTEIFDPKLKRKRILYLKVEVRKDSAANSLILVAAEVSKSETPKHLQEVELGRKILKNPADSRLEAKLFRK